MPTVKARVGTQNVVKVLAQQTAASSKLINLNDVETSARDIDGMILVWDLPTSRFVMTSVIDHDVKISDSTQSYSATEGALVVTGGVGISGNINVAGIATFGTGTVTIDGDNDLVYVGAGVTLSGPDGIWTKKLVVDGDFEAINLVISGIASLATNGGITTTGGDLTVAKNLHVAGISTFDGNVTFKGGTIGIGDSISDDINVQGEFISNLVPNEDATYDLGTTSQRWRDARFSGLVTTTTLQVSSFSQFTGISTFTQDVNVDGTLTAGLIDGGIY